MSGGDGLSHGGRGDQKHGDRGDEVGDDWEEWDLSWLLETVEPPPPAGVLEWIRRRAWRRRRVRRGVVGVVVVAAVVVAAALGIPTTTAQSQRVQVGPAAQTPAAVAAPSIAPAPASAGAGWKPLDFGLLRVWLPPAWTAKAGTLPCGPVVPPKLPTRPGGGWLTLSPCQGPDVDPSVYLALDSAASPMAGQPTRSVNGLSVEASGGATQRWYIPSLHTSLVVSGSAAVAVADTLQPSPVERLLEAAAHLPSTVPAGWKPVIDNGLVVHVPAPWTVLPGGPPTCSRPSGSTVRLSELTGTSPSCPADSSLPVPDLSAGVTVVKGLVAPTSGVPPTRATTASGTKCSIWPTYDGYPDVVAQVIVGGQPYTVEVGIGSDPSVAWHILGSISALGTSLDTTPSSASGQ